MEEGFKRYPAVEKTIDKITEDDTRVSFMGEVLERSNNRLVVGDEKREIEVVYDDMDVTGSKKVRVVGIVRKPLYVKAEAIQDMSALDMELYVRVKAIFKRL